MTVTTFLTTVLAEIRAVGAGDVPAPEDLDLALTLFNELLDTLNANQRSVYASTFTTYTLTPNLQPHTIGLVVNAPTFTVTTNRPESIEGANIVLTNVTPNVRTPLDLRDAQWWLNQRVQGATSSIPTDLHYRATWPNGSIYLWPVPTTAYGLELQARIVLAVVALTDTFTLPPGYQQALRLTLAELCASAFGVTVSPMTVRKAQEARALVWGNHDVTPRLISDVAGWSPHGGGFDYRTGTVR